MTDRAVTAPQGERLRSAAAAVLLFLLTFAIYWSLGPQSTPYDFQLSQANNIVHGHLEMSEEHTRNLMVLERVLFDGEGFCLPVDDPRGPERAADLPPDVRVTPDCRHYMQHSLGPALLLIPLVLLFGLDVNQTLISVLVGALTAVLAFAVVRHFTSRLLTQVTLTVLVMFSSIVWWAASNGGVWFFAHTTAVFFLFAAIWATVVRRSPLLAGAFVGAAFMCRPTTIMAGFFPLVFFADQWLAAQAGSGPPWRRLWSRLRLRPLVELAIGVAPFIALTGLLNFLRFGNPFESGYNYSEEFHQLSLIWRWDHGVFHPAYIPRHAAVVFEQMPVFAERGSYVWPSWFGLAMWVTTPALLYGLFVHLRLYRREALFAVIALGAACLIIFARGLGRGLGWGEWATASVPLGIHLLPFWVLIGVAITLALRERDRLVLACWAAIIPLTLANWIFAATGWAQFGYRYGLDALPFLFLLVVVAVGAQRLRWHHFLLILAGIVVNLWGVLWIYHFAPARLFDWTWVSF